MKIHQCSSSLLFFWTSLCLLLLVCCTAASSSFVGRRHQQEEPQSSPGAAAAAAGGSSATSAAVVAAAFVKDESGGDAGGYEKIPQTTDHVVSHQQDVIMAVTTTTTTTGEDEEKPSLAVFPGANKNNDGKKRTEDELSNLVYSRTMEQGKHDRRSLLRQGGGRAGPDDDQQHLLGNIFSRDRRSPPQQDDNKDPEAKVDQKNDDSQFLFGEGQCVDFSGCEGDPKKQAVCRKRFLFLPQKTICVRWSSRISLLLRRGGKCGCCSVEEEPDRPEYCDALVGSDPTTAPSLSPTLMPSAPPSPVPTELTLVVNVKALFDAQQDESLSLLQKAQVIASILNATVVPNSVLYPGLFGTRPIVDLEFQVRFEDPFFDLDVFAGDATLRDSLVVSLTAGQKIIKVSNCTEQCGSAEQDVPPGYCYPPTDQCVCTGRYGGPTCSDFCFSAETDAACNAVQGCTWCNTTATCLVTQNLARTSEEVEYCAECSDFTAQERFCTAAPLCDYCPSTRTCTSNSITNGSVVCPFDVKQTSPKNGEENVALTRETVIDFSEPLDPSTVSSSTVQAAAQTGMLNTTLYLSSSGLTLTIFFQEDLPANADITIRITGGLKTMEGNALAGMYEFYFSTLSILPVAGTLVCGRVFASELSQEVAGEWLDVPLEGVTISVDGNAAINAVTQSDGTFTMNDVPAGTFFVHIDGRTSPAAVNGSYYPNVGKSWTTVAGTMNSVGTVYLPLISSSTLQELDDEETTIVEFPEEVIESDPRLEGVFLAVPPGSLIDSTGSGETPMVGIAPVDRDRLPGTLPPTLRLPLVITIQTVGGSNFDVPVPVCFPNLPDPTTNSTLEPGDTTSLWSFNHDTGRFDVVGPATVNIDGTAVCSDPGYGIVAPGWHGAAPGTPTDPPDDEPECEGDPCCESDDPCCGSDNGGGGGPGGGGPGGTGWGEAAFSAADSVFGCLKDYISKKGGETWEKGVKCGSSIYGLGKDLVGTFRSDTAPKTGQDVVDAASKIQGGKWGIINDCVGTVLNVLPVLKPLQSLIGAYKCANSLAGALDKNCEAAGLGGNPECSTLDDICKKTKDVLDFLKPLDTALNILNAISLGALRRRLSGLDPPVADDDLETFIRDAFFDSQEQYDRISLNYISDTLDTLSSAIQDGLTEEEILALADQFVRDMEVMVNITEVMNDLDEPMNGIIDSFDDAWNGITSYSAAKEKEASESTGVPIVKRQLYLYIETEDGTEFRVKTTEAGEIIGFVMAPTVTFACMAYDARKDQVGFANGLSSPNGVRTVLPSMVFTSASVLEDTDGDGLCDMCEFIIGTNPEARDSDSDGTGDRQEILSGTNPLDGLALTTGVVGNFPLPRNSGSPVAVEAAGSKVYVALSTGGIACYNTFDALEPSLTGLIGSGYVFEKISARENAVLGITSGDNIVLLSGPDYGDVLEVVGVAGVPTSIYLGEEYALVGTSGFVYVYTSDFNFRAQDLPVGGSFNGVDAVTLTPFGALVAVAGSRLHFFPPDVTRRLPWEESPSAVSPARSTSTDIRTDTERIYVASFGRIDVFSVSTGLSIGSGNAAAGGPTNGFVPLDSSGENAVLLTGTQVQLWSVVDPTSPQFQGAFDLGGSASRSCIAAANGIIYVGTSTSLSLVNVFPPDTGGVSPTINQVRVIDFTQELADSSAVEEFRVLRAIADVTDDVTIRQVLFVVNGPDGEVQRTLDSIFPYSTGVAVPPFDAGGNSTLEITVTAWDIAGNVAETLTRSFEVIEDTQSPIPNVASPEPNSTVLMPVTILNEVEQDVSILLYFSEPTELISSPSEFFELRHENNSQANSTEFVFDFSPALNRLEIIIPKEILLLGLYNAMVLEGMAFDSKGNPSDPLSWTFTLASNELFADVSTSCTVSVENPCRFKFRPNNETQFWQYASLTVLNKGAPSGSRTYLDVFKGPDDTYPSITSINCYQYGSTAESLSDPNAFVLEPSVSIYTVEITSLSAVPFDVDVVLSGTAVRDGIPGQEYTGTVTLFGQVDAYNLLATGGSKDREIIVKKDGDVLLQIFSTDLRYQFTIQPSTRAQLVALESALDYWIYVRTTPQYSCRSVTNVDQVENYTFSIIEPVGVSAPELNVGETTSCTVNGYGDWCDFTFDISEEEIGFPLSFHIKSQNLQLQTFQYRAEIWFNGRVEYSRQCTGTDDMQIMAEFRPEYTGTHILRVREWSFSSGGAYNLLGGQVNVTYGTIPETDAIDLPVDTVYNNTFSHEADIGWYQISNISRGDVVSVTVSRSSGSRSFVKVFTATGRRISQHYYYGNGRPAIEDLVIRFDGPLLIAFAPTVSSQCDNGPESWKESIGLDYDIAVWKRPPKAPSTDLASAPSISYGDSVSCVRSNIADFCQFRLSVSEEQVGFPLSIYVIDTNVPSIQSELQILQNGKEMLRRSCPSKDLWSVGDYFPQSPCDLEIRVAAAFLGNLTVEIGPDPVTSFAALNDEADRSMNFTRNLNGTFGELIGYTFHATSGDRVSVSAAYETNPNEWISLVHVPSGLFVQRNRFSTFADSQIPFSGRYAVLIAPDTLRVCKQDAGFEGSVDEDNATIVITKVSGEGDAAIPNPVAVDGSLSDILRVKCSIGLSEFLSCAFTVSVSDEEAKLPMSLFLTHPPSDIFSYQSEVNVFHSESYSTTGELYSFRSCWTATERLAYSLGTFSFPRSGSYVIEIGTRRGRNISQDIDLFLGANKKEEGALTDGDIFHGEFQNESLWETFVVEVPSKDVSITLYMEKGDGRLTLIDPAGSTIGTGRFSLQTVVEYPGTYTVIVSPDLSWTCVPPNYFDRFFNTTFSVAVHLSPAYPQFSSLSTLQPGNTVDCVIDRPFGECFYKLNVGLAQIGIPYTIFPEIVALGNNTNDLRYQWDWWGTRVDIFHAEEYPDYGAVLGKQACASTCHEESCFRTSSLDDITFTRSGSYILKVSNAYGELTGSVSLTMEPSTVEVVSEVADLIADGPALVTGSIASRETAVFSLENIVGDISVDQPDAPNLFYLSMLWLDQERFTSGTGIFVIETDDHVGAVDATLAVTPRTSCYDQDSAPWIVDGPTNFTIRISEAREAPSLPLPLISAGDVINCTISSPAMYCAYEFVISSEDVHNVLPLYFDSPHFTSIGNEYWQTFAGISKIGEYPDWYSYSRSWSSSTSAWDALWYTVPSPGKYVLRIGNSAPSYLRAMGSVQLRFGNAQRRAGNETVPFNQEFVGSGAYVDTYPIDARKGMFVAVEVNPPARRFVQLVNNDGDREFGSDTTYYATSTVTLFELGYSGTHQVVIEPSARFEPTWDLASEESYSVTIWQANPEPGPFERIPLVQNGPLDFECTVDRPWSYCTFELDVSADMVGTAISVVASNVRNITDKYELNSNSWDTSMRFDENEYEDFVDSESGLCGPDGTTRGVFVPRTLGKHTLRIGNSQQFARGAFEVSFSDMWQPQEILLVDESVSRNLTRWGDAHSFRVNITDSRYRVTVETPEESAVFLTFWNTANPRSQYTNRGSGTIERTFFSPSSEFVVEVSPRSGTAYCEDLEQVIGASVMFNFTITLSLF